MSGHCLDCKHWQRYWPSGDEPPAGWAVCAVVGSLNRDKAHNRIAVMLQKGRDKEARGGYRDGKVNGMHVTELATSPEFGCEQFEAKEKADSYRKAAYQAGGSFDPELSARRQIVGCHSANNHCPFCHEMQHSGQTWCVLEDSPIKDAEDMWDKVPSWCPLRLGPIIVEWNGAAT